MRLPLRLLAPARGVMLAWLLLSALPCGAGDWTEPTPEERAMTASGVEPGADAEALLWEVRIDDDPDGRGMNTVFDHYVRLKVFSEAGAERHAEVSIVHAERSRISLVRARTIGPDGQVANLSRDAVFATKAVQSRGENLRSTSFAIPGVRPGSIVEYRYRETRFEHLTHYMLLPLQREIPVRLVRYDIRPIETPQFDLRHVTFNTRITPFKRQAGGFYGTTASGIRSFHEEPHMPPGEQVRAALLVYYSNDQSRSPDEYWISRGRALARRFDDLTRPNGAIRRQAEAEVAGSDENGLRRLFDWCRAQVRNRSQESQEDRPGRETISDELQKAPEVFERRAGSETEVNLLFASLARAAGYDVRLAQVASRNRRFFDPSLMVDVFLDHTVIAVRAENGWTWFDPGTAEVPFGTLRWPHEGSVALICDADRSELVQTPMSPPGFSAIIRSATLALDAEGTLEGEVRIVSYGHANADRRRREAADLRSERERAFTEDERRRLGTAEITDARIAAVEDTTLRYETSMHVVVPDYAQPVSSRLLLQPAFFERGREPPFSAGARRHAIVFDYAWMEIDTVRIALPPGYIVESDGQPGRLRIPGVGEYAASMRLSPDARELIYVRLLRFGDDGTVQFPAESYPALKSAFDSIHRNDATTVTLLRVAEPE